MFTINLKLNSFLINFILLNYISTIRIFTRSQNVIKSAIYLSSVASWKPFTLLTCLKFFAWYRLKNYFQTIHKVNSNLLNISFTFRSSISLQNASTADFVIGLERATCRFMMVRIIWLMLYAYFTPWRCKT